MSIYVLDGQGNLQQVETLPSVGQKAASASLPVVLPLDPIQASGKTAVTGNFTGTGQSSSFTPIYGRLFNVFISVSPGVATIQLEKSYNGSTWFVISDNAYQKYKYVTDTRNFVETIVEYEVGVTYRLNCTSFTSGTISYRISQ